MRIDALAPAAFYRRFVRTGLPVVLVGAHLGARANSSEGRARWEGRRDAIRAARESAGGSTCCHYLDLSPSMHPCEFLQPEEGRLGIDPWNRPAAAKS